MILIVIYNVRWVLPCLLALQFRESCLSDLQHKNVSVSPEIHVNIWPVNWENSYLHYVYLILIKHVGKLYLNGLLLLLP